jgi:glucoamylase
LNNPAPASNPDEAIIRLANGAGDYPARNIVSCDFLELVRLGVRDPHDPLIVESVAVIDRVLKHELPQGPCWRRFNHDAYGQKDDGSAFDGAGTGRCWPLLTGERGHYELAAGRDSAPFLRAMEGFANDGRMLPEQVWDSDDLPDARLWRGRPTGSAMPLCWAHAEYLTLLRSRKDGFCFDRIPAVYQRYVQARTQSRVVIWTRSHQVRRIGKGL